MAEPRDVIIVGGGHNGLITAFYLAKAGFKTLLLERRDQVGGAAITEEFHPGFRCSTLAHSSSLLPEVVRDMALEQQGLKLITREIGVTALSPDGQMLALYNDVHRAGEEISRISPKDAEQYAMFQPLMQKIGRVIGEVLKTIPPDVDRPSQGDLWSMLKTGRSLRKLGKRDMYRVLRWGPMAVADLVAEFFTTELLRAVIAARGIFGTSLGPWSAGSGLMLMLRGAGDSHPAGSSVFAMGGTGAITQAMAAAAQAAGAQIRTGAEVKEIRIKDGVAHGVVLANGDELSAKAIVSNADPRRTLLKLVDPEHLPPDFVLKLQHYRMPGTVAKVNLALSALPKFTAVSGKNDLALCGRIHIGPEIDYLERAFDDSKYGNFSQHPYLEVTIPSLNDPTLVPVGKHVMSIYMQFAPFKLKQGDWKSRRDSLAETVVNTLAEYAPDLPGLILNHQTITPQDLEDTYGLTGGHIFHGEPALDQFFTMRPLLGWSRYRTPISNLYLCGSGTHPGVGLTGGSGTNAAREIARELRK